MDKWEELSGECEQMSQKLWEAAERSEKERRQLMIVGIKLAQGVQLKMRSIKQVKPLLYSEVEDFIFEVLQQECNIASSILGNTDNVQAA